MPWQNVRLGELATFRNGLNFNATDRGPGVAVVGIPDFYDASFVDYQDLDEVRSSVVPSQDALLIVGDILFVRSNGNRELIGRSLLVREMPPKPTSHSGFTIRLRFVDRRADPSFFAYLLRSDQYRQRMSSQGGGTSINNLNQGILSRLEVPLPPLETQRRVAAILGAYDDLIEVNRRRVAVLEEMARGLFQEFIVRPIGCLPHPSGAPPMPSVPEGWQVSDLASVADIVMGQSPPAEELNREGRGYPFHQGVTDFGALFPGHRVYCVPSNLKRLAKSGDILFSVRAPVGRINLATEEVVLGRGVASISSRIGSPHYVLAHLRSTFFEPDLIGNGAIYKAVGRQDIQRVPIILPTPDIRYILDARIAAAYDLIWALEQSNEALATSRDLLLPRLISGQLSLEAATREMEEVA